MKNLLFLFAMTLLVGSLQAQFSFGIKGGLNTINIAPEELSILNAEDAKAFGIAVKEADYGMHFGLFTQQRFGKFIIRPEFIFSSNKLNYKVTDFSTSDIVQTVKSETYQNLDIPVLFGIKTRALRIMAGPVGHVFIHSKSELTDLKGYKEKFEKMTYGYQLGLGLDAGRLSLDGRFEGSFNKASDHFTFFGNDYAYSSNPSRFMVSLGFRF